LDVIIEREVLVAVLTQQTEGVGVGKILKLDKAVHPIPVCNRNINIYFFRTQERNKMKDNIKGITKVNRQA